MSTAIDPRNVIRTELLSDVLLEKAPESFFALVKVLTDFLQVTAPEAETVASVAPELWSLDSPETVKRAWEEVMGHIVGVVAEAAPAEEANGAANFVPASDQPAKYTPEELAVYYGAPIDTIYRWIEEGRFVGIRKKSNSKKLLIPETTYFITYGHTLEPVSRTVESYHQQCREMGVRPLTRADELEVIRKVINMYEDTYGGTYEETLGAKKVLTHREECDAEIWLYALQEEVEFREE